jgi:hypothetical protein
VATAKVIPKDLIKAMIALMVAPTLPKTARAQNPVATLILLRAALNQVPKAALTPLRTVLTLILKVTLTLPRAALTLNPAVLILNLVAPTPPRAALSQAPRAAPILNPAVALTLVAKLASMEVPPVALKAAQLLKSISYP